MINLAGVREKLKNGSAEGVFAECKNKIEAEDVKINAFITKCEFTDKNESDIPQCRRKMSGVPIAVKDSLCTKDVRTTAASKMLENWVAPYDATAWARLKKAGAVLLGKTNCDEFTMGGSGETSFFGATKNPCDVSRVPGGSSSGSAAAVAAGMCAVALGTDTGGSIRQPASYCGVVGVKPSYGRVSRYGLIAHGSSFDNVGPMTACVRDSAEVLEIIAGRDKNDATSVDKPVGKYVEACGRGVRGMKVGIPKEFLGDGVDAEVKKAVLECAERLRSEGAEVSEVTLPHSKFATAVYYILGPAEISANMARYDGVRFGHRGEGESFQELFRDARSKNLGDEVKRRIALGTFVLSAGYQDAYYNRAMKVRDLIKNDFEVIFQDFDALISPVAPTTAFRFGENADDPVKMYLQDLLTIPASCAGIPAMSVPFGKDADGLPIGVQVMAGIWEEEKMFAVGAEIEKVAK